MKSCAQVEVEDDILEKLKKESGLREEAAGSSSDSFVTSHCPSDILPRQACSELLREHV